MNDVEVLVAARQKVEQGWCQRSLALDADGISVHTNDPRAVAWCALGALYCIDPDVTKLYLILLNLTNENQMAKWNDAPHRTKEDVLKLYQTAIDSLKC